MIIKGRLIIQKLSKNLSYFYFTAYLIADSPSYFYYYSCTISGSCCLLPSDKSCGDLDRKLLRSDTTADPYRLLSVESSSEIQSSLINYYPFCTKKYKKIASTTLIIKATKPSYKSHINKKLDKWNMTNWMMKKRKASYDFAFRILIAVSIAYIPSSAPPPPSKALC